MIGNVLNFISLEESQEAQDKWKYRPFIYLILNVQMLINSTLSIFNELKDKNLFKITWNTPINRDRSLRKEIEHTLLNMIKNTITLKELDIWVVEKASYNIYSFKFLSKSRKEQICNTIWESSLSSLSDGSKLINLDSFKVIGDSISYYW